MLAAVLTAGQCESPDGLPILGCRIGGPQGLLQACLVLAWPLLCFLAPTSETLCMSPSPTPAASGFLTSHVLDTVHGTPASGMGVSLYRRVAPAQGDLDNGWQLLRSATTNDDGRLDAPLLKGDDFQVGSYRLVFDVAAYFQAKSVALPQPPFLDRVPLDFGIADVTSHYHVPLLVSPWSYSTYRGS